MTPRMELLHKVLHGEEGEKRDADGKHIAHLVDGKWHIGFGHCLDQEQSDEELEIMKLDDELHDWKGFTVNDEQAYALFEIDIDDALCGALLSFTQDQLHKLDETRWTIILSMCYQMGSIRAFKSFIKYVKAGEWDKAADEMEWSNGEKKQKRSAWYLDTPERCAEAAQAMRDGYFQAYQPNPTITPDNTGNEQGYKTNEELIDIARRAINELEKRLTP